MISHVDSQQTRKQLVRMRKIFQINCQFLAMLIGNQLYHSIILCQI